MTLPPGKQKVIILDEADSMTKGAQQALRRTMEVYSAHTRFALACNTSTKIIEPIQSRCAILRYSKLSDEQVLRRLMQVCAAEGITWDAKGLEALVFTAEGDMRNALNNLQSTFAGFGEGRRMTICSNYLLSMFFCSTFGVLQAWSQPRMCTRCVRRSDCVSMYRRIPSAPNCACRYAISRTHRWCGTSS